MIEGGRSRCNQIGPKGRSVSLAGQGIRHTTPQKHEGKNYLLSLKIFCIAKNAVHTPNPRREKPSGGEFDWGGTSVKR